MNEYYIIDIDQIVDLIDGQYSRIEAIKTKDNLWVIPCDVLNNPDLQQNTTFLHTLQIIENPLFE